MPLVRTCTFLSVSFPCKTQRQVWDKFSPRESSSDLLFWDTWNIPLLIYLYKKKVSFVSPGSMLTCFAGKLKVRNFWPVFLPITFLVAFWNAAIRGHLWNTVDYPVIDLNWQNCLRTKAEIDLKALIHALFTFSRGLRGLVCMENRFQVRAPSAIMKVVYKSTRILPWRVVLTRVDSSRLAEFSYPTPYPWRILKSHATRLPISRLDFSKTSSDDSSRLDSNRQIFLTHPISLNYFTLSPSPLDFRWLESLPTKDDSTLCGYIGRPSLLYRNLKDGYYFTCLLQSVINWMYDHHMNILLAGLFIYEKRNYLQSIN